MLYECQFTATHISGQNCSSADDGSAAWILEFFKDPERRAIRSVFIVQVGGRPSSQEPSGPVGTADGLVIDPGGDGHLIGQSIPLPSGQSGFGKSFMIAPVLMVEAIRCPGNSIQLFAVNLLPAVGTLPQRAVFYPLQRFADFDEHIPIVTVFLRPNFL